MLRIWPEELDLGERSVELAAMACRNASDRVASSIASKFVMVFSGRTISIIMSLISSMSVMCCTPSNAIRRNNIDRFYAVLKLVYLSTRTKKVNTQVDVTCVIPLRNSFVVVKEAFRSVSLDEVSREDVSC